MNIFQCRAPRLTINGAPQCSSSSSIIFGGFIKDNPSLPMADHQSCYERFNSERSQLEEVYGGFARFIPQRPVSARACQTH